MIIAAMLLPIFQEDIRSVNSTWLLAILVIGLFVVGLLNGITGGGGGDEGGDTP